MPAEQVDPPAMDWELAADEVIAACGGDAREAVKALLAANASLEREVALWAPAVSYGFSRGWHRRKRSGTD
ncbi:MAG: hypothetical protein E5W28_00855 [Mesorhizobium sp.]|nr:hypothetical protein [Mesorhizobium sp.]RWE82520.1 MAG: hypothetical protein EOS63_06815 [Mesorhizobium sp.]TIU42660.1 MAG: hypothetical protein E5W28_00855 [Mesorhizobium sp.]TJW65121.1 MAG: hypothetical protein E5V97_03820 [Mesorhizobium sp.]